MNYINVQSIKYNILFLIVKPIPLQQFKKKKVPEINFFFFGAWLVICPALLRMVSELCMPQEKQRSVFISPHHFYPFVDGALMLF